MKCLKTPQKYCPQTQWAVVLEGHQSQGSGAGATGEGPGWGEKGGFDVLMAGARAMQAPCY